MLFPDRFLEQVEPLQHPEAEASEVVEVADPPEEEQLLLLQEDQEPLQPELLQLEPLQKQQPEEVPLELPQEPQLPPQKVQEHLPVQRLW